MVDRHNLGLSVTHPCEKTIIEGARMSPTDPKKRPDDEVRGWLLAGVGVLLCGTLLSLTMIIHQQDGDHPRDEDIAAEVTSNRQPPQPFHTRPEAAKTPANKLAQPQKPPTPHARTPHTPAVAPAPIDDTTRLDRAAPQAQAAPAEAAARALDDESWPQAPTPEEEALTYTDPINAQVLGPGQWMARLEPVAQAQLDEIIDSSPVPELLAQQQRQTQAVIAARALAKDAAQTCLRQWRHIMPKTSGQVMLTAWLIYERPGITRLMRPNIQAVVGLGQPDFLECILAQVRGARLAVDGPEELRVELPLFLD